MMNGSSVYLSCITTLAVFRIINNYLVGHKFDTPDVAETLILYLSEFIFVVLFWAVDMTNISCRCRLCFKKYLSYRKSRIDELHAFYGKLLIQLFRV